MTTTKNNRDRQDYKFEFQPDDQKKEKTDAMTEL